MEEAELEGFSDSEQSFFAANVVHDQLVQVTMTTIRMIDADGVNLIWYVYDDAVFWLAVYHNAAFWLVGILLFDCAVNGNHHQAGI